MVASAPQVQIGELCDLIAEQRQPAETPNAIYVGLEHVESGRFQWKSCGRAADVQSHKFAFKRGDVLYSKLRPYLDKAVLADVDGLCTTELLVLRAKPGIDPRFLACVVHTPEFIGHAMTGVTGAQHPRTSWSHIESFEIPRFSSAKQAEISGLAWKIHELLISSENSIAAGEHLKRAAMKELFSRGVRGAGQTESDIGLVPNGWIVKTFSEVREWLQYGTSTHCTTEIKAFPVLRIPNVEPGRVNATDLKYCDLSDAEAQKYLLQPGDLLFIRTNGVLERLGACAVYDGKPARSLFASYLIRARLKEGVHPRFIAYFFGSNLGTSLVAGRATPAADGKFNLNTGTIDSLPLPMPQTLDEQREVVSILDVIAQKNDLQTQKRDVLSELLKSLLSNLMTGAIALSDPERPDVDYVPMQKAGATA